MTRRPRTPQGTPKGTPAPIVDTIAPVGELRGIGPDRVARLARMGIHTVRDLLLVRPSRLHVWPEVSSIASARKRKGERVTIAGRVRRSVLQRIGGKRSLVRATLADDTGEVDLVFFNQPWMREQLSAGTEVTAHGLVGDVRGVAIQTPRLSTEASPLPEPGTLATEYAGGDRISGDAISGWIEDALERYADRLVDPLPPEFLESVGVARLEDAVRAVHRPTTVPEFETAQRRFALQPILALQARVHARRRGVSGRARSVRVTNRRFGELAERFPFTLTAAQERAAAAIRADLEKTRPMRRLMQGDVGCGKTAVAALGAMTVAEGGGQVAVMAPTEVLASQHAYGLAPLLEAHGIRTALLTGSLRPADRRRVVEALAAGEVDVVFGTHALFSDDVAFRRLDLVVIDEQHRFGVAQRDRLAAKGRDVHLLLMTATPIPRTLALSVYGDLDVSSIDELPPGRGDVRTLWARTNERRRMPREILARIEAGEQVYWVVPRIGGDEGGASAEARFEDLARRPGFRAAGIELVHGKLPVEERAMRLDRFRSAEVATIVATTVVEVGVDVPNATVMVIEDAHKLGLAQLHQLRGRIGRGQNDSVCYLLGDKKAEERFRLLERTNDGFEIAEADLRQRGMGDLLGLRQSGENLEGLIDPERDLDLLLAARDLFAEHPELVESHLPHEPSRS